MRIEALNPTVAGAGGKTVDQMAFDDGGASKRTLHTAAGFSTSATLRWRWPRISRALSVFFLDFGFNEPVSSAARG